MVPACKFWTEEGAGIPWAKFTGQVWDFDFWTRYLEQVALVDRTRKRSSLLFLSLFLDVTEELEKCTKAAARQGDLRAQRDLIEWLIV